MKRVNVVTEAVKKTTVVQGSGQGDTVERSENISQMNDDANNDDDDDDDDDDENGGGLSDFSDVSDVSQISCEHVYSLDKINTFFEETFEKSVDVRNNFPDLKRLEASVRYWQRKVGEDEEISFKKKFLAKL